MSVLGDFSHLRRFDWRPGSEARRCLRRRKKENIGRASSPGGRRSAVLPDSGRRCASSLARQARLSPLRFQAGSSGACSGNISVWSETGDGSPAVSASQWTGATSRSADDDDRALGAEVDQIAGGDPGRLARLQPFAADARAVAARVAAVERRRSGR